MAIIALGYLGVRSDRPDDWSDFAGRLLGMQRIDRGGKALAFRMDDLKQRLVVSDEPGETLAFMGWEVAEATDLDRYAVKLEAAGVPIVRGSRSLADRRFVFPHGFDAGQFFRGAAVDAHHFRAGMRGGDDLCPEHAGAVDV